MNTLNFSSNYNARIDNLNLGGSATSAIQISSSNGLADSTTVTSSAYTQLTLGSLTDVRGLWVLNDNATYSSSFITIASGSTGQNVLTVLGSGDAALIPWSGSLNGLYAKITSGANTNGVIQYAICQS